MAKRQVSARSSAAPPAGVAAGAPNEPAAEWVPIDSIHEWKDNPRKNDGKPVAALVKSIKRFGFGAPILARRANGEIIGGHTRWKAAKKLGLARVPVRFLDLDPAEAHVLALADNKLGELADWDEEVLGAVLADLKRQDTDLLEGTGFDEAELTKLLDAEPDVDLGEESGPQLGDHLTYTVLVECGDEREQAMMVERFERDGLKCRPIVS